MPAKSAQEVYDEIILQLDTLKKSNDNLQLQGVAAFKLENRIASLRNMDKSLADNAEGALRDWYYLGKDEYYCLKCGWPRFYFQVEISGFIDDEERHKPSSFVTTSILCLKCHGKNVRRR